MGNYIFELKEGIVRKSVSYANRFGIPLSADLYLPKDFDETKQYAAILIGCPYGGTKEQGAGIYAQEMAERGFVALTFDPSFYGYSGGAPRYVSSPEIYSEDFSAGVDFLGTRSFINREKIGVIGICGSGGFSLSAAQVDPRMKAIAVVSMYDMSRAIRYGLGNTLTDEARNATLQKIAEQRYDDFVSGRPTLDGRAGQMNALTNGGNDAVSFLFAQFYLQPRGYHHHALTQHTFSSMAAFMNYSLLAHINDIAPRPLLFVIGEQAHSRYFSEDVYNEFVGPKELYVVPGANHTDLYDRVELIPFEKLNQFFTTHLV